jgi:N,N'-diacetyllegionaminate synthase
VKWFDKILDLYRRGEVYVIAELGSNYKSHDDLVGAISLAKACGADAIKYQYFTPSELYGPTPELDADFPLARLSEKCKAVGIDFLCSAFSPEGLRVVDEFVPAHKIASSEMSHVRLLEAAKGTGKPVILSTGAWFPKDITRALKFFGEHPVVPLHCNVSYPTKFVDLAKFRALKSLNELTGYSDHTTSIDAVPRLMKSCGATVYEKHFNPFGHTDTPDAPHSLALKEFKAFVSVMRHEPPEFTEENEARLRHCRRIVATRDILPGDVLREGDNIGIYRSRDVDARGENPFAIYELEGRVATKPVRAGEGVSISDVR